MREEGNPALQAPMTDVFIVVGAASLAKLIVVKVTSKDANKHTNTTAVVVIGGSK